MTDSVRKAPTKRDLLLIIGALQNILGEIDCNPCDQSNGPEIVKKNASLGFNLCIDSLGFFPQLKPNTSKNGWNNLGEI